MDWIAIAIERIEQQIDELNDVVDSVYRSWSDRNKALTKEIKAVSDESNKIFKYCSFMFCL